jgi:putative Holliday junction resolvase
LNDNQTRVARIIALDYGTKRVGVALSDETNSIAFGKEALRNDEKLFEKIAAIVKEYGVRKIILGYPLNLKGDRTRQTEEVEAFEFKLKNFFRNINKEVAVIRYDERFTSKMAQDSMILSGMKKKKRQVKSNLDIISATLILQSYLDSMK